MSIQDQIASISMEEMATVINSFFLAKYGEEVNGEFIFPPKAERSAVSSLIADSLEARDAGPLVVLAAILAAHGTVYSASRKLRGRGGVYRSRKQLEQAQLLQAAGLADDARVNLPFAFMADVETDTKKAKAVKV